MKFYLAILTILGWFALAAQFQLTFSHGGTPPLEIVIRYFSYFTITTNILVAFCSTTLLLAPRSKWGDHFSKPTTLTAITVYIVVVGIIYNLILRYIWQPQGLQRLVDELLHLVIPLLFLFYWIIFVTKKTLTWNDFWPWLIYPLVYTFYIFIRGYFSGWYPYPFLDVDVIGWGKALINSVGIAIVFVAISLLFIAFGRWRGKKE
ncbi:Pr6Pr family membrane protein [Flavitalea flava]